VKTAEGAVEYSAPQVREQGWRLRVSAAIGQARLQMSFALTNPVSYPLIAIVVGWATALFCGFRLMSKGHTMSVIAVLVGAMAVSASVYMILDLSSPCSGVFRTSATLLEQVLEVMGKE
jgi:hypothetical protein